MKRLVEVIPTIASTTFMLVDCANWTRMETERLPIMIYWGYGYLNDRAVYLKYGRYYGLIGKVLWYNPPAY